MKENPTDIQLKNANYELNVLKRITLDRSSALELQDANIAVLLAVYLVDYDAGKSEEFLSKKSLLKYFKDNLIRGQVLVYADEEDAREMLEEMIGAICENAGDEFPFA